MRPEENWLYFIELEANDKCMYLGRWENAIFSQMYQNTLLICTELAVIKYSSVQTETKLLYGWVIGISVRFGDKYQVKNLYACVKMIKEGKEELHEQPPCVIFLMILC